MDEGDEWDAALELQFNASAKSFTPDSVLTSQKNREKLKKEPSMIIRLTSSASPTASSSDCNSKTLSSSKKRNLSSSEFDDHRIPQISFSFPGWGIEIKKGRDQLAPSVIRAENPGRISGASVTGIGDPDVQKLKERNPRPWAGGGEDSGSYLVQLPEEVIVFIFHRLGPRDLCALRCVSKQCRQVAGRDDIWEGLLQGGKNYVGGATPPQMPKLMQLKHTTISDRTGLRFEVLRQGHVFLRAALQSWWMAKGNLPSPTPPAPHPQPQPQPQSQPQPRPPPSVPSFTSATVRNVVKKLTHCNWMVLYEALGIAFEDCADQIAHSLMDPENRAGNRTGNRAVNRVVTVDGAVLGGGGLVGGGGGGGVGVGGALLGSSSLGNFREGAEGWEGVGVRADGKLFPGSSTERDWDVADKDKLGRVGEGMGVEEAGEGRVIWRGVVQSWEVYSRWLKLVANHGAQLQFEVMLERSRALGVSSTPTLYDKGVIAFRGSVVLSFALRRRLQAGLASMVYAEAVEGGWAGAGAGVVGGPPPAADATLLRSIRRLYQELDVLDDTTCPSHTFTQAKFRRCFQTLVTPSLARNLWAPKSMTLGDSLPQAVLWHEEEEEVGGGGRYTAKGRFKPSRRYHVET